MDPSARTLGILAALLTPFREDGSIDRARFAAHAADVIGRGADGVAPFGTTGEGASIGFEERAAALDAMLAAGVAPGRIVLGVCASAVPDAAAQLAQGLARGIERFLVVPPFYFPDPGAAGLRAWHEELLAASEARAGIVLYHIPQMTGTPLPAGMVADLAAAHPDRILAIKDSSGDWDTARGLLERGRPPVLVGDERLLHRALARGGGGSINGMANLWPERLAHVMRTRREDAALSREVDAVVAGPIIPSLKALMARRTGHDGWRRVRAPLAELADDARARLLSRADLPPDPTR